jgi:hypothetical protein
VFPTKASPKLSSVIVSEASARNTMKLDDRNRLMLMMNISQE